jgi:hypothetical protein
VEDNKIGPAVGRLARAWITIGWAGAIAFDVAIAFVQRETSYRSFEYADMGTDCAGIVLGWMLAPPRLPNLLALSERCLPFA